MENFSSENFNKISNYALNKINNLNKKNKAFFFAFIATLIISNLMSLLKINIPGLSMIPAMIIFIAIGLKQLQLYKSNGGKINLILSSILLGFSTLTIGCFLIIYPFIIISMFAL